MDANGRNPRRLSTGSTANYGHSWSPDSQWLSFIKLDGGVYKVAVAGGEPTRVGQINGSIITRWAPDGEWILTWKQMGQRSKPQLVLVASDGSDRERNIDISKLELRARSPFQLLGFRWGSNMETLYSISQRDGIQNIVKLSLKDGSIMPIMQFTNHDMIFSFSVSPDESELMITRGVMTNDIVMLRNFH